MQNTGQPYRGTVAPGVNYSDHSYDNQIGVHCQPSGYQPYTNSPYHPIPSPRPHHYANHQMQQGMPYRHHGGAYAPNQNQYTSGTNHDAYRNHHSGYIGGNRNIPSKSWPENNSSPADLMPSYGQVSPHPQMMSSPSQLPVSAMRSPPHAASNMNPAPSPGPQHFRQMHSPAHSPHSWSQAQIPSPGMMHSRTTPSPLPAHVRSPGHSQPFSPPAATHPMNMQPHLGTPENGQIPPPLTSSNGNDSHNSSDPLHSLQKMVMLERDAKSNVMPMPGDTTESFPNQCGAHNYMPEEGMSINSDSKDSSYSTYYNLDENRFESKPNDTVDDAYANVQQVSNCNFPVPSLPPPVKTELSNPPSSTTTNAENISMHPTQNSVPMLNSTPDQNQCKSVLPQNESSLPLNECPPHAESAPVFTDQTKEAVSTNSEQALKSNERHCPEIVSEVENVAEAATAEDQSGLEGVASDSKSSCESPLESTASEVQVKTEFTSETDKDSTEMPTESNTNGSQQILLDSGKDSLKADVKSESEDVPDYSISEKDIDLTVMSPVTNCDSQVDISNDSMDVTSQVENSDNGNSKKSTLRRRKVGASYEEAPSPENDKKGNPRGEARTSRKSSKDSKSDVKRLPSKSSTSAKNYEPNPTEIARNPVKVVIHRIRQSNTNDTWHVPGNNKVLTHSNSSTGSTDKKLDTKPPTIGPQIIILSPAMSQKKFGIRGSMTANSLITTKDNDNNNNTPETTETKPTIENADNPSQEVKPKPELDKDSSVKIDKKRGRPVGARSRAKAAGGTRRRRVKKNTKKKRKPEPAKPEPTPKAKKLKPFTGPYIRITGTKQNPASIAVINVAQREEEKDAKAAKPNTRSLTSAITAIKNRRVGHLSTLSPTYDAFNRDQTWLCVFCHKGSHHSGLGDLYGPYYIKDNSPEERPKKSSSATQSSPVTPITSRAKRRKSDASEESKCCKRTRQGSVHSSPPVAAIASTSQTTSPSAETEHMKEVWLHEDCAVWCQSISLIGEDIRGLEEAVCEVSENICTHCSLPGATVGCLGKGCKEQYHYICAKEKGCQMNIENFSLLCAKHQNSRMFNRSSKSKQADKV